MGEVPITVMGCRCDRCNHEWIPRDYEKKPLTCPRCKSAYWNTPPKQKSMMTYEAFRDAIEKTILEAPGAELTWTEIRTGARLPQKFPNNQWVRRMEKDIGLKRSKDSHGIIKWTLS
jgi:hypothetical protein